MRSIFLPIIIAISLLVGCNKSAPKAVKALNRAEAVMEEHPDSAFKILSALDTATLCSDADRALYALLYTQAQVKNKHKELDDSLILSAVSYYNEYSEPRYKMLANYYYGLLLSRKEQVTQSVQVLLIALDIAEQLNDNFYAAMASRELSVLFEKSMNPAEEVEYAEKAYEYINKTGKQSHIDWEISGLAIAYNNHQLHDKSIYLAQSLIDTLEKRPNQSLEIEVLRNLIHSLISTKRSIEAIHYAERLISLSDASDEDKAWLGLCYALTGKKDSANIILQQLDTVTGVTDWLKYELATQVGNKESAYKALKNLHDNNEKQIEMRFTQSATLSMLKHHEQEKEIANEKAKTAQITIWLIIISCVFIISIGVVFIIVIRRRQKETKKQNNIIAKKLHQTIQLHELEKRLADEKNNKIQEALYATQYKYEIIKEKTNHLSQALDEKQTQLESVNQELLNMTKDYMKQKQAVAQHTDMHYKMIDEACTILWENPNPETASGKIEGWLNSFIAEMGATPEKLKALEDFADKCYNNIMSDLHAAFPKINEKDYKLFLYNLFGLSSAAIAKLIKAEKIDPVYTRKKRLRRKFQNMPDDIGKKFLQYL